MAELPDRILQAHGGLRYWESLSGIEVEMSAGGFLFTAKRVPALRHARLTVDTRSPEVVLHDYPQPGQQARLHGNIGVEILDADGTPVMRRERPREAFGSPRHLLRWDALDFAYFCGYAMWGYLTVPFLLRDPGVRLRPGAGDCLEAEFGPDLPVHSAVQRFWFDAAGRLTRNDYTADVVGRWAAAVHLSRDYRRFGGLWAPTTRRVYPRGPLGRPLPWPTLVAVDIHDLRPVPAPG